MDPSSPERPRPARGVKHTALVATAWSGAEITTRYGLQFLLLAVLARLLSPADFGMVAMLALFSGLAGVIVEGGFSTALIQRQDVSHEDESTVYWLSVAAGALAGGVLAICGPAIARFFQEPRLAGLSAIAGLTVFIGSCGAVHVAILSKRLRFSALMKVGVVSTLVSGGVAVALAAAGFGVWSLAIQSLAMTTCSTALLWLWSGWRPRLVFSAHSVRSLFRFGSYVLVSNLMDVGYTRAYAALIGRFQGMRDVGFYNQADNLKQVPAGMLSSVFARVAFPMFSAAAHDKQQLRRGMQLAIRGLMLVNVPVMLGLMVVAEPFVMAVFGHKWLPMVPVLRVLCLAGVLWPMHVVNVNVLMALGQSRTLFRAEVVKKSIGLLLLVAGAMHGVLGIAWSQVAFSVVSLLVNAWTVGRLVDYGIRDQVREFAPSFVPGALMALAVALMLDAWQSGAVLELAVAVLAGAALYAVIAWMLRLHAIVDMLALLRLATQARSTGEARR